MANLPETPQWEDGIYQIEVSDPVLGGPDGITNRPLKQLASRTSYLKQRVEKGGSDLDNHIAAVDPHNQYAPKTSPIFTGAPTAPTPANNDNSKKLATTEFVSNAVAALAGSAPETLDTLKELADALGNDPNFATTVLKKLAEKLAKDQNGGDIPDPALFVKNLRLQSADGSVGRLINCQLFTAGGQYTPTSGMKFILAHMIGGGGASGGTPATTSTQTGGAAAGNSGAYAFIKAYASDIGAGKAVNVGSGGISQVNGAGFAGGTTSIADIADVTGGYGSGPGVVSATTAVAQPSYSKPVINKYNRTEILASSLGSQAWNFLQSSIGSGTGWLSPASPYPGGERGRGGSGLFVNASAAAQAGLAGVGGAILIMEYA